MRMLVPKKDVVVTPYRVKEEGMKYAVKFKDSTNIKIEPFDLVEIEEGPAGLTLIHRKVFERLMDKPVLKLENFPFHHNINTRWRDLDAFRHVNNATFLSYIEDARILLLRRWKINFDKKSLIVASVKIDYLKQIKHPSSLILGQRISRLGNKSFDIQSAMFLKDENEPSCFSTVTSVAYDFELNKTIKVYPEIINDFKLSQKHTTIK